jgi:hypothetical protein
MQYDLFISYARTDDRNGQVSNLVDSIKKEFGRVAGKELRIFFDKNGRSA